MPIKQFQPLPTLALAPEVNYFDPLELPVIVHWDDPAVQVLINFKHTKAVMIGPEESIDAALMEMKACPYHVLLVVNKDLKILGLISSEDLLGEKPLKAIQEHRISRADISVRMVMTPQVEVIALDMESLRHAKVGHIVATLHAHRQHYAVAVKIDPETQAQSIRGLFASSLISKQLGTDVTSDLSEAHSIAELHHDVRSSHG